MKQLSTESLREVLGPLAGDSAGLDTEELDQLAAAIFQHGRRCVRPRPGVALSELPFETDEVPWSSAGRFLSDSGFRPGSSLHYAAGDYAIQDAASLLPITLMQLEPGQSACDVCAAPGGKSAATLEQLGGEGLLFSNEVIASRVDTLQLALARTGHSNYLIASQPVERLAEVAAQAFDCVLVDAPCTGQSMLARGKQSLSAFSERQITHSAARQRSILSSAIRLVRPGGRLVYSTCTFAFEENEAIIAWLRELLPAWRPVHLENLSAWQVPGFAGCYRLWPHRDTCAGGFAAALIRPLEDLSEHLLDDRSVQSLDKNETSPFGAASSAASEPSRSRRTRHSARSDSGGWQPWTDSEMAAEWGELSPSGMNLWQRGNRAYWFDPSIPSAWRSVAEMGIEVAAAFGEHWQPSYPLATLDASCPWFRAVRASDLNDSEAIQYMSGASLHRPGAAGWSRVTWRGRSLAWGKQVANQLKNHLPKPLRQPNLR